MNIDKLKDAIERYKESFPKRWDDEKYKWEAVKRFQDVWNINADDFVQMFTDATDKTFNLLASLNNFPRGMIIEYAKQDVEAVRSMFMGLYDESKDVTERILKFQSDAQNLCEKYSPSKQHYQRPMAITVYLWLRYPDKYDVFKYSVCKETGKYLENDFIPKKGNTSVNVKGNMELIDDILAVVNNDADLIDMEKNAITDAEFKDEKHRTLAFDISFYIANYLAPEEKQLEEWIPKDYDPQIPKEEWIDLMDDETVFTQQVWEILYRMRDYGGQATCTQLSVKYGETKNFYNIGSSSFAKRVAEKTGCPIYTDKQGNQSWWPVLYVGRSADKDEEGCWIWKIRPELNDALDEVTDWTDTDLYANKNDVTAHYWWLNASPAQFRFSDLAVGESVEYSLYNDNGNKRRIFQNFLDARVGDFVICYESNPVKQVVALAKVMQEQDGQSIYFEKIEGLNSPIDYATLKEASELEKMEYFVNPQGSLFKLTHGEYDFIMDVIREENPVVDKADVEKYDKEKFLSEVYMTSERYDTLKALLLKKQNIILQGAPGVGKTFAAKRLAYSIMEEKDESRIEFVQFHQSYSYEDFIMGYKPSGEGFELQNGIFYKFCQKAANRPELPYFFIIDEINRGNMSKIFGELLMLIEKDYRGTKATLAYNGLQFSVPKNVYIIGMMNTADRSLALIDYALRRRFSFFAMEPGFTSEGFVSYMESVQNDTFVELIDRIRELNAEITKDSSLGSGFCIGHSYFCGEKECTDEWMQSVVEYDILPMLEEYWFDESSKLQKWQNILRGVFND